MAGGTAVYRMEGLGHERQRRLRPVLCRAIHAGAESHGHRTMRDYPRIVVPPPGPKTRAIAERQERRGSAWDAKEYPLAASRGERAAAEPLDGNSLIHCVARSAV